MVEGKGIVKRVYKNFTDNFKSFMLFEVIYKLFCGFIFIPINYKILNLFMNDIGVYNITNKDLIKIGLTPEGLLYLTIVLFISFIAVFIEIGILTYMSYKSHEGSKVSIIDGIINTLSIFPRNPSVYMICLILISGIIGPLTGIGLYSSLITRLTIPAFIKIALFKSVQGKFIYGAFIIGLIVLLLRWLLAIPIMVIEDVSFKNAFRNSLKIYKNSKFRFILSIITWVIINYALRGILLGGIVVLVTLILTEMQSSFLISSMIVSGGIVVFYIVYVLLSIITLPLFISFLVEVYYRDRYYKVNERVFLPTEFFVSKKFHHWTIKNRRKFIIAVTLIFIVVSSTLGVSTVLNNVFEKDVEITAHRGGSKKAPENSIAAINTAIVEGADYVEIDVQTTKDDQVVLFHDATLKRIEGSNRSIKNMDFSEVKTVDIGSYFSESFEGEKIPTLEEALIVSKDRVKLNIELKIRKKDDVLPEKVVEILREYDMEDQVIISSQNYEGLQKIKELNPLINVGYILSFGVGDFSKLNIDFVSVDYSMLKKELVYKMHILGKEVHVWTINDKKKAENAIRLGADNIITDSVTSIQNVSEKFKNTEDIDYLSRFYACISSIIKYVKI